MSEIFKNKVVVITGAGRGIGASTAKLFAGLGAKVVLASRTETELNKTAESLNSDTVLVVPTDVGVEDSVKSLFEKTKLTFGPVDLLINNAGYIDARKFEDLDIDAWEKTFAVNARGTFLCSLYAYKQMIEAGNEGSIINISSLAGIESQDKFPGFCAYTASKHAVVGLTQNLAVEAKDHKIKVNCVAPGAVDTVMLRSVAPDFNAETKPEDLAKVIGGLAERAATKGETGTVIIGNN